MKYRPVIEQLLHIYSCVILTIFSLFSFVAPLVWIIAGSVIGIVVVSITLSLVVAFVGKF